MENMGDEKVMMWEGFKIVPILENKSKSEYLATRSNFHISNKEHFIAYKERVLWHGKDHVFNPPPKRPQGGE